MSCTIQKIKGIFIAFEILTIVAYFDKSIVANVTEVFKYFSLRMV